MLDIICGCSVLGCVCVLVCCNPIVFMCLMCDLLCGVVCYVFLCFVCAALHTNVFACFVCDVLCDDVCVFVRCAGIYKRVCAMCLCFLV